jgi:hypothetical protein
MHRRMLIRESAEQSPDLIQTVKDCQYRLCAFVYNAERMLGASNLQSGERAQR